MVMQQSDFQNIASGNLSSRAVPARLTHHVRIRWEKESLKAVSWTVYTILTTSVLVQYIFSMDLDVSNVCYTAGRYIFCGVALAQTLYNNP